MRIAKMGPAKILTLVVLLSFMFASGCVGTPVDVPKVPSKTMTEATDSSNHSRTVTPRDRPVIGQDVDIVPSNPDAKSSIRADINGLNVTEIEQSSFDRINAIREEEGVHALHYDGRLSKIARHHSYSMALGDFYSHVDPKLGGPTRRMVGRGFECPNMYGETIHAVPYYNGTLERWNNSYNLTIESDISNFLVDSWMHSPGHRHELLQEEYDVSGIGIYVTHDERILVTQEFCG